MVLEHIAKGSGNIPRLLLIVETFPMLIFPLLVDSQKILCNMIMISMKIEVSFDFYNIL